IRNDPTHYHVTPTKISRRVSDSAPPVSQKNWA
ncbi:unnamed protein product, partial [marine sediment metagenome]